MAAESLKEGETCSIVLPSTKNDPKVIELDSVLKDWVNETLASERIIVKDLRDDLYDGNGLSNQFHIQWGEVSRWLFDSNPARGGLEKMAIGKTHRTLNL